MLLQLCGKIHFRTFVSIFAPVKLFFFILSSFLLYLSCLPCRDNVECNGKTGMTITATDNHQKHDHRSEACTPFCSCSCCPASAFYAPIPKLQEARIDLQAVKYPLYKVAFNTRVSYSIWQPPKIS